jgi:hypothetical protein
MKMREPLRLPSSVEDKVVGMGEYSLGATLVTLTLRDGKKISNVVMAGGLFISWINGCEITKEEQLDFSPSDIVDAERQVGYV